MQVDETARTWPLWLSEGPIPKRAIVIGILVVVISCGHAIAGLFFPRLPAWKMFRKAARYDYRLRTSDGQLINIRDHVPARAYTIQTPECVGWIGEWYIRQHPDQAPLLGQFVELSRHGPVSTLRFVIKFDEHGEPGTYGLLADTKPAVVQREDR